MTLELLTVQVPLNQVTSDLGPLGEMNGFNLISLPDFDSRPPSTGLKPFRLRLNVTFNSAYPNHAQKISNGSQNSSLSQSGPDLGVSTVTTLGNSMGGVNWKAVSGVVGAVASHARSI